MTRPTYESESTLHIEHAIKLKVEAAWNCRLEKLPISYRLDFLAFRADKPVGAVEVKRRYVTMDHYPTIAVSLAKRMAAQHFTEALGIPVSLAVRYDDKLAFINLGVVPDMINMGGRTDRSDDQDTEPMVHFNTDRMIVIEEG